MDYNKELKTRLVRKIAALDKQNGGDYKKTMHDIMAYAKKGTGELTKAVDYGDYIAVTISKNMQAHGVKGHGTCVINFDKHGNVLEYLY